jgi:DNA-directed RNA polymerase specialized sigma24 family protein
MGTNEADGSAGPDLLAEHATDVGAALATLAPRERTCIVLRYVEHLSIRETAEVLDLSEGSVKRYVSDGIAKLNGLLGTLDGPELTEWVDVKVGR